MICQIDNPTRYKFFW